MLPYFSEVFGNAASKSHSFGWRAEEAVDHGRRKIASAIGAQSKEIVFTSGATESNNLAILGVARMFAEKGQHVITAATEHKAVLDPCHELERLGYRITILPVDRFGRVSPDDVEKSIEPGTILISLMTANNEIGTFHPIADIGKIAKKHGILFHTDAAQAIGKTPFDVGKLGVDLVSISAHKLYGPKGVGALYIRSRSPRVRLHPVVFGGGHERGFRPGTLNVPGAAGFGKAVEIAAKDPADESKRILLLRSRLHDTITQGLPDVHLNGHPTERLPGNLNLSFERVEGEALLMGIKDVAVSSGSACTSASLEPSHVLRALGVPDPLAHASIRYGIGRFTTEAEIDFAAQATITAVRRLRETSPLLDS